MLTHKPVILRERELTPDGETLTDCDPVKGHLLVCNDCAKARPIIEVVLPPDDWPLRSL